MFKDKTLLITGGTEFTIKDPMKDDRISYLAKYPNIRYEYNPSLKNTADELIFIKEIIKMKRNINSGKDWFEDLELYKDDA